MGLDMYLTRKTYVKNWDWYDPEQCYNIVVNRGGTLFHGIKSDKIKTIEEEVGYWRKANQIHRWFVLNVQDGIDECQESYVETPKLKELLDIVNRILALPDGADRDRLAAELLPTQPGFFFGSYDYDEWYYKDLEDTKQILLEVLEHEESHDNIPGFYQDYYYHSSW